MASLESRAYAMLALAELASHAGLHDQAIQACDEVLVGPADRRSQQFAMVEKALSLLAAERLTDANNLMDGFRTMEFVEPMGTMAAVAGLYRQIRTGRFHEAAASADSLAPRARHALHQQAAYAYGLLALALERAGDVARAQRFYDCATRLAGPAELAERFGELAGLERRLTPARSPL
jgi:tetratricopeptide (TPR) repeat protein